MKQALSQESQSLLNKMGSGMRLLIARGFPNECTLVNDPRFDPTPKKETISLTLAWELIRLGVITELSEFGERQRIEWREAGFDGEHFHVYACTQ